MKKTHNTEPQHKLYSLHKKQTNKISSFIPLGNSNIVSSDVLSGFNITRKALSPHQGRVVLGSCGERAPVYPWHRAAVFDLFICPGGFLIFLTVVYVPPKANFNKALEIIFFLLQKLKSLSPDTPNFILGNFNNCSVKRACARIISICMLTAPPGKIRL